LPWEELHRSTAGRLRRAGDAGFPSLDEPFVPRFGSPTPAAVLSSERRRDVGEAVLFARRHGVPLAVRSGGHCSAGLSSTHGLLIEVSALDSVRLHGDLATVGAGTTLARLVAHLGQSNRAVPAGTCPSAEQGAQGDDTAMDRDSWTGKPERNSLHVFYALDVGRCLRYRPAPDPQRRLVLVSMPSTSGGALRPRLPGVGGQRPISRSAGSPSAPC